MRLMMGVRVFHSCLKLCGQCSTDEMHRVGGERADDVLRLELEMVMVGRTLWHEEDTEEEQLQVPKYLAGVAPPWD